jgi:hypothetical protein
MIELPPIEPDSEKPGAAPAGKRVGPETLWKKSAVRKSSRGALLTMATLLFCGIAGVALGVVLLVGAAKKPYLITLPIEEYGNFPTVAAADVDSAWLYDVFEDDGRENAKNFGREAAGLRGILAAIREGNVLAKEVGAVKPRLETDRPLLIHVVCHAEAQGGKVYLLPGDATADSKGWVPLDDLLAALADCPAKNKCLLLDAGRPATRTFIGPYADETTAPLHEHLQKLADAGTLACPVIVSCGKGEQSHVMAATGVSAFAFYAAEGLRGAADGVLPGGSRDKNVSVRELHAFLKLRVGRWVKQNRDAAQSPTLYAGSDFKLVYGERAPSPATVEEEDVKPLDPWKLSPPATTIVPVVTEYPGRSILSVPVPVPPPAAQGSPPAADPRAAVRATIEQFWKAKLAAKTDAKVDDPKFDETGLSPEVVGRTLWEWLLDKHPAPPTGLLVELQKLLAPLKPAEFRELATLDFVLTTKVANYTPDGEKLAGKLFAVEKEFAELLRLGEPGFAWVGPQAVELVVRQRSLEGRLRAGQDLDATLAALLEVLRRDAAVVADRLKAAQAARASLNLAVRRLTGTALAVAEFDRPGQKPWAACLKTAAALADQLGQQPSGDWKLDDWKRLTAELEVAVKPLTAVYEPAAVKVLVDAGPKAGPAEVRVMEATRAVPFLAAADRASLNQAINEAAKRLHLVTRKDFDLPENGTHVFPGPERLPQGTGRDVRLARQEVSRDLHVLAGLGTLNDAAVPAAWGKAYRTRAADLVKSGEFAKLERLLAVEPFGLDPVTDGRAKGERDALAARRQREVEAYREWRTSCSR